jgi:hypothetical protein
MLAGGIVLAGLIVLGVMWITSRNDDPAPAARPPNRADTRAPEPARAAIPADWIRYTDPAYGWSISKPPEWEVRPQPVDETSVDLRDPESGAYLRVDWTTTPGDDAVAAWEAQAEGFAAEHADYVELGIAPAEFRDWPAATWEFTYTDSGAALHALDLGFVIDDAYGFALYFQTHAEDWESMEETFAAFKRSFRPPR